MIPIKQLQQLKSYEKLQNNLSKLNKILFVCFAINVYQEPSSTSVAIAPVMSFTAFSIGNSKELLNKVQQPKIKRFSSSTRITIRVTVSAIHVNHVIAANVLFAEPTS